MCPCPPLLPAVFLPSRAWTFTAPTILHWAVSPMIDVEITPGAQCRDDAGPPRPPFVPLFSLRTFFFFFFLPHPSFDRIREPESFRLPRGVTPWRIFSPVSPRAIRSRGSSGWIFNEAIYTGFVICTDQANLLGIENFNFLDLFVQFFGHLFSSPRTRVLQYPPFLLNLLY